MLDKLEIGVVTSPHGLKGDVKVFPTTDETERYLDLDKVLVQSGSSEKELTVERVAFFKGRPIVRFREISTVEEAQKIRGAVLLVRREDAIPLEEGEYFIGDLIGSRILSESGEEYGILRNILRTGANDVYEIAREDGSTAYIAAVKDYVLSVDAEEKVIRVRVPREI